jgi:hypothetical protein
LYGSRASSGGISYLYTAADCDTTIGYFAVQVYQDDFWIGPSNDLDALKLTDAKDLYLTDGDFYVQHSGTTVVKLEATATTGTVQVGVHATRAGNVVLYGDGAGEELGGNMSFYVSADYDGSIAAWFAFAYEDDFIIGNSDDTTAFKFTAEHDFYITAGSLVLPASEYINLGGTLGSGGYGFRDNAGEMEFKDSGEDWNPISPSSNVYIDPFMATRTAVNGTWGLVSSSTLLRCGYLKNTSEANGNAVSWPFYCGTGTYTLNIALYKSTNLGILDAYIDNVEIASFDCYAATLTYSVVSETSIALSEGAHTLKFVIDGKNGSSSAYILVLNNIMLERTA